MIRVRYNGERYDIPFTEEESLLGKNWPQSVLLKTLISRVAESTGVPPETVKLLASGGAACSMCLATEP